MTTLLDYLNSLPVDQQHSFSTRCQTTIGYMRQIAYGHRKCSAELAISIERESHRAVLCEVVCPTADWRFIRAAGRRTGKRRATAEAGPAVFS